MKESIKKHPVIFGVLLYTLLFAALYMLSLGDNAYVYNTNSDAAHQYIPEAISLKRLYTDLLHGDPAYIDFNTIFGSEQLFSIGLPFNPFNFILVFLPDSAVVYYLKILCTSYMYLAGIGFIVLGHNTGIKPGVSAVSALMFAFSPYIYTRGLVYMPFIPAAAVFPFMIAGMERIFQGKSIKMLLIASIVSVLVNSLYLFSYGVILTVIYAFVRVIFMGHKGFFKNLWKYGWRGGLAVLAGIFAAAAAVLPQIYPILSSTRTTQIRSDVISTALTPDSYFAETLFRSSMDEFAPGAAIAPLMIIFIALKGAPKLYKFLLGLCVLTVYIPIFPAAMCTFSYIEHRWAFAFTLLSAWCAAYVIQHIGEADLTDRITACAALIIYMMCSDEWMSAATVPILCIFLILMNIPPLRRQTDRFLKFIDGREKYILEVIVYLVLIMFTVILIAVDHKIGTVVTVAAVYAAVTVCCIEKRAVKLPCLLAVIPLGVLPICVKALFVTPMRSDGDVKTQHDWSVPLAEIRDIDMAAGDEIVRFESIDAPEPNISFSRDIATTRAFVNLIPQRFADMLSYAGFDMNNHTSLNNFTGFEHRLPFMSVWGVDYIHTEYHEFDPINNLKKFLKAPETFEKTKSYTYNERENNIYKNPYALPFGFTYDSSISEYDRRLMNGADYGINMMYSAAIEGETGVRQADPVSFTVPYSSSSELITYDENADITYTRYILTPETPVAGEVYLTLEGIDVMKHRFGTVTIIINDDMENFLLGEFGGKNTADTFQWFTYQDSYTFCCSTYDEPVEKVEVRVSCDFEDMQLVVFPLESYKQQFEKLSEYTLQDTVLGNDEVTGRITVPDERILCLQLLYTDGWEAYDNGVPAEIIPVNGCMTGLRLSPGEHEIRLVYHVPGLAPGMAVSCVTVVILIAVGVICRKKAPHGKGGASEENAADE